MNVSLESINTISNSLLVLDRTVQLATDVRSYAAFRVQFAINHNKQKHAARRAVSGVVKGVSWSGSASSKLEIDGGHAV